MLKIEFEAPARCLVIRVLSGPKTEQDWALGLASFLLLDDEAHRQNKDGIAFIVVEPNAERPNSTWRRKLAEQRKQYKAKDRWLILVTDSLLFRGVLRAVNWLAPPAINERNFVTASIQEGVAQAEAWRGEAIPVLRGLLGS